MAVYTPVPFQTLETLLTGYRIGKLQHMEDILEGVENSNFRITTDQGNYIFTVFEKRVKAEDLPFFLELMRHLALKGIPCPLPIADEDNEVLHNVCGKPSTIVTHLNGTKITAPTPVHCQQIGGLLARMHRAGADMKLSRANALSVSGWEKLAHACAARADEVEPGLNQLIQAEFAHLKKHWPIQGSLPHGVVHADLFMDNVFFENGQLSGVFDFYFACNDFWAYDLAITINAWCFENQKVFSQERFDALMKGYAAERTLLQAEREALPLLLRGASLRFLLTRLYDWLNHPPGALVMPHDPLEYARKLRFFQDFANAKAFCAA